MTNTKEKILFYFGKCVILFSKGGIRMKVHIPKPYMFVGTLLTAGVVVTVGYNIIVANNNESVNANPTEQTSISQTEKTEDNFQQQLDELKEVIREMQSKINVLEEQNEIKNETIAGLQSTVSSLNNKLTRVNSNNSTNSNLEKIQGLEKKTDKLRTEMDKLLRVIIINEPEKGETKNVKLTINIESIVWEIPENPINLKVVVGEETQYVKDIAQEAKITTSIQGKGKKWIKIYINGILKRQKEIDFNSEQDEYTIE